LPNKTKTRAWVHDAIQLYSKDISSITHNRYDDIILILLYPCPVLITTKMSASFAQSQPKQLVLTATYVHTMLHDERSELGLQETSQS